jgi:hypothetical protein
MMLVEIREHKSGQAQSVLVAYNRVRLFELQISMLSISLYLVRE